MKSFKHCEINIAMTIYLFIQIKYINENSYIYFNPEAEDTLGL